MTVKINVPKTSEKEIWRQLKKRKFENPDAVKVIENYLAKKRGFIFKLPKGGDRVILLVSGGLDSTITWGLMMEKFKLKVYPVLLDRGRKRKSKELKAVSFFSEYYKKKYPKLFIKPKHYTTHLPPPEVEKAFNEKNYLHEQKILDSLGSSDKQVVFYTRAITPFMFPFYGLLYSKELESRNNLEIKNIFVACGTNDGTEVPNQTFTAMRATLLSMCLATSDFSWNFASFPMEKEIGHWLDKEQIVSLGLTLRLPLEKTWSCYRAGFYQCGNRCITCMERRHVLTKLQGKDKTKYESDILFYKLINFLKS